MPPFSTAIKNIPIHSAVLFAFSISLKFCFLAFIRLEFISKFCKLDEVVCRIFFKKNSVFRKDCIYVFSSRYLK